MKAIVVTVDIERPASEVYDLLEEAENNTKWLRGMRSCVWTTPPPVKVGSRYEQQATYMGKQITTSFEVTELVPGRRVTIRSREGSSFPLIVTREVEPRGEASCRVTETIESDPTGFYRIGAPLLRLTVRVRVDRDYRRLKQLVESSTRNPKGSS